MWQFKRYPLPHCSPITCSGLKPLVPGWWHSFRRLRRCELSGESILAGHAWGAPVLRLLPVHSSPSSVGPDVSPPLSVPAAMLDSYPSGTISQRNSYIYISRLGHGVFSPQQTNDWYTYRPSRPQHRLKRPHLNNWRSLLSSCMCVTAQRGEV